MLLDEFTTVSASRNQDDLFAAVLRFAQRLEFDRMTAMTVVDHADKDTVFKSVQNAPQAYHDSFADPANWRRDPVMQHCKFSGLPIVWDQKTYVVCGCPDKWERQAPYGYATGIALALHLPRGQHFQIGFDRDQSLPQNASQVTRMVADMQLFAVIAHEAAFRVLSPESTSCADVVRRPLSPRELECLRWTMEGKTAWEVGRILSISEQTAVRHVNNAMHKLGCINKHQAVLKAIRLGLLR